MPATVSIVVFCVLSAIALLHGYWAFGGLWPATNEQDLINTVVGAPHLTRMPTAAGTLIVAALIIAAAFIALSAGGALNLLPRFAARLAAFGAGAVFLVRGVAGLAHVSIFRTWNAEPFATLNVQFYSPLCLLIGAAFLYLGFAGGAKPAVIG